MIYIRKSKPSFPSSKITSTEEILNGKLIFFCSAFYCHWREFLSKVTFLTCKLRYFSKNLKSDWISMISQVNGISELELYKPQESWQIYTKNLEKKKKKINTEVAFKYQQWFFAIFQQSENLSYRGGFTMAGAKKRFWFLVFLQWWYFGSRIKGDIAGNSNMISTLKFKVSQNSNTYLGPCQIFISFDIIDHL